MSPGPRPAGALGELGLAIELNGGWRVSLYPGAGEAVATFVGAAPRRKGTAPTGSSAEKNERDASTAAARRLRLYVVANGLSRFLTLDWAVEPADEGHGHADVKGFITSVRRAAFDGRRAPWVYVLERGENSGRLHAHVVLPSAFDRFFETCWTRGGVTVRRLRTMEDRRACAQYMAKDFTKRHEPGAHRYRAAQGFAPEHLVSGRLQSRADALEWASSVMGRQADANVPLPGFGGVPVHHLSWDEDGGDPR